MKFEKMEVVGVQVRDIDVAVEFFSKAFDLEFTKFVPGESFDLTDGLDNSDTSARLVGPGGRVALDSSGFFELVEVPEGPEGLRCFHVKVDDLEAAKKHMEGLGFRLVRDIVAGGMKEAVYHADDLHGARLCLVEYEEATLAEALARK